MSFYGPRKTSEVRVNIGDAVEVVRGRKVPLGTSGVVFWIGNPIMKGQSRFAVTTYPIGVRDSQGQVHWTYDENVKVTDKITDGKPVNIHRAPNKVVS